jgi:hypothetical protein
LRNAAAPRRFKCLSHMGDGDPDWLAGAGGFELPNHGVNQSF